PLPVCSCRDAERDVAAVGGTERPLEPDSRLVVAEALGVAGMAGGERRTEADHVALHLRGVEGDEAAGPCQRGGGRGRGKEAAGAEPLERADREVLDDGVGD